MTKMYAQRDKFVERYVFLNISTEELIQLFTCNHILSNYLHVLQLIEYNRKSKFKAMRLIFWGGIHPENEIQVGLIVIGKQSRMEFVRCYTIIKSNTWK